LVFKKTGYPNKLVAAGAQTKVYCANCKFNSEEKVRNAKKMGKNKMLIRHILTLFI